MTRLENWRKNLEIWYPSDIAKLRAAIPELDNVSDAQIEDMYSYWSEEFYCAGWLMLDYSDLTAFRTWLLEEV